jgi:diaminopimelate decarboxylase
MPVIQTGDLLAVPMSGAYQLSMASNYNGARKPAVLWLENEGVRVIQQREGTANLLQRDETL